jgi:hypothetical protein
MMVQEGADLLVDVFHSFLAVKDFPVVSPAQKNAREMNPGAFFQFG